MSRVRVLVCGGRHYTDARAVFAALDALAPEFVIEGGATGADALARAWRKSRGIDGRTFGAKWYVNGRLDRSAGPRRNQQMLDEGKPDLVLAFPGGNGTIDMTRRAFKAGIEVRYPINGAKP